jgi:hypothetical protein
MIVNKTKISTAEYDSQNKTITYFEHGIAQNKLILEQLQAVLEFSKTHPVVSIIADFRNLQGSFKGVFDFLHDVYYPTLKSRGLKCKAFILSLDIINNYLANELVAGLKKHGIDAAIFSDPESANKWVQQRNFSNGS